jgi:hypothetical protein
VACCHASVTRSRDVTSAAYQMHEIIPTSNAKASSTGVFRAIGYAWFFFIKDEMIEPRDNQASSMALLGSNLSSCASAPPNPASVHPGRPESSPSTSHQQTAPSSGKARRAKKKRAKWKGKLESKAAEIKPSTKQEASATRLANRLARTQTTVVAPFAVSSVPKNRSGFTASLRKADKAEVIRLRNDLNIFIGL